MKKYDGATILEGMCFDVNRMIREQQNPKMILRYIQKKISFLENPKNTYIKIVWWNTSGVKTKLKCSTYFDIFPEQAIKETCVPFINGRADPDLDIDGGEL